MFLLRTTLTFALFAGISSTYCLAGEQNCKNAVEKTRLEKLAGTYVGDCRFLGPLAVRAEFVNIKIRITQTVRSDVPWEGDYLTIKPDIKSLGTMKDFLAGRLTATDRKILKEKPSEPQVKDSYLDSETGIVTIGSMQPNIPDAPNLAGMEKLYRSDRILSQEITLIKNGIRFSAAAHYSEMTSTPRGPELGEFSNILICDQMKRIKGN